MAIGTLEKKLEKDIFSLMALPSFLMARPLRIFFCGFPYLNAFINNENWEKSCILNFRSGRKLNSLLLFKSVSKNVPNSPIYEQLFLIFFSHLTARSKFQIFFLESLHVVPQALFQANLY